MSKKAKFVYSDDFSTYRFHEDHPFNQQRVLLTKELLEDAGILSNEDIIPPRMATDDELALYHKPEYINAVKQAGKDKLDRKKGFVYGLGTEDNPMFPNMHEAASYLVGGTLTAVDAVLDGVAHHALNLGGGLHHALERQAAGFCIYNDGAVAINYIRKKYNLKVLYVDTDAHHGDGVQWAFYDDPNVCTFSIHETGRYLFPGTGDVRERGMKDAHGYSFNLPIDAYTQDESFIELYETAFKAIAAYFQPDVILTQNGADAHTFDPLTHLCGSMRIYERIPLLAHELAHTYCDGKWIATGGGGYDMWRVVPRAWAQIWSVMKKNTVLSGNLPKTWLNKWKEEAPLPLPDTWHDEEEAFPAIPRKTEIEEKNLQLLDSLLKYTKTPS
jgi:acetoin utilization protein AcuC